jgi:hypothetical protein
MHTLLNDRVCRRWDTGSIEQVIPLGQQAIRLSPRDPGIGFRYQMIGTVHLLESRADEAIVWLEKVRDAMPALPQPHLLLAAAYGLKDETERAAAELAAARRLAGEGSYSSIARMRAAGSWLAPKNPRLAGSHLFGRPAQGRNAGAITDTANSS